VIAGYLTSEPVKVHVLLAVIYESRLASSKSTGKSGPGELGKIIVRNAAQSG